MFSSTKHLTATVLCVSIGLSVIAGVTSAKQITLKFSGRYVKGGHQKAWEYMDKAIKEYEKMHPDIKIQYISELDSEAYRTKLLTMAAAGSIPDIINLYQPWLYDYAERGIIDPIPAAIAQRLKDKQYPATTASLTVKGRLYAFGTENQVSGLMYSKKILSEAGIGVIPDTWDELMSLAAKLKSNGAGGAPKRSGFAAELVDWNFSSMFRMFLTAYGGKFLDNKGQPAFTSKEGLNVLTDLRTWYSVTKTASTGPWDLASHKVAFGIGYPWHQVWFENFKDKLSQNIGVADMPGGVGGRVSMHYTWGLAIAKASKHKKEALDFAEWLTMQSRTPDDMTYVGAAMAGLGSLPSAKNDAGKGRFGTFKEWYAGFTRNLDYAKVSEDLPRQEQIARIMWDEVCPAILGKGTPEAALGNAKKKIEVVLAKRVK